MKFESTGDITITLPKTQLIWIHNALVNEHNTMLHRDGSEVWLARCRFLAQQIEQSGYIEQYDCSELRVNPNEYVDPEDNDWDLPIIRKPYSQEGESE